MIISYIIWEFWAIAAKVDKIITDKDSIYSSIACNVVMVDGAVFFAVKRIVLKPYSVVDIAVINVISTTLFSASSPIWNFLVEAWVRSVFAKAKGLGYSHCVDEMPSATNAAIVASATDNPISYCRTFANRRFTGCKRAISVEGVGRKPAVVAYNVGM